MQFSLTTKLAAGLSVLALAACNTTGGGTASTSGGTSNTSAAPAAFQASRDAANAKRPTTTMPTSLNATYVGETFQVLSDTNAQAVGNVLADLTLNATWTDGQSGNVWSGKATNLRGELNGQPFDLIDEMDVDTSAQSSITRVVVPPSQFNPGGQTSGIANIALTGTGTSGGKTYRANMMLTGTFRGDDESAIVGSSSSQIYDTSVQSVQPVLTGAPEVGSADPNFYANRQ